MKTLFAVVLSVLPQLVKRLAYRAMGIRVSSSARIGFGTVLRCDTGELQSQATIGVFCLVRVRELRMGSRSSIGNLVRIGAHSITMRSQSGIGSQNEISGDPSERSSSLYLGPASRVMPHCYIDLARPIKLGRNVGVGGGSYLFTHGMWLSKLEGFPVSYGGITIDNDVWLPWGCFVMPNVKIGSRVVVGARAVITKDLPSGVLAAGVPAKVLRANASTDVTSEERAEILVQITEALASKIGARVRIERTPDGERHLLDDQVALFVHRRDDSGLAAPPVLNVVPGPLNGALAQQFVLWSLRDSTSSPYAMISSRARQWFARARSMGVRFYPIDEDLE